MIIVDETEPEGEVSPPFQGRDIVVKVNEEVRDYFDMKKEIGRGRFGTVFLCNCRKTDVKFAAKFINTKRNLERKNVEREIEIMKTLHEKTPNLKLIQLYDAFDMKTEMCLILEIVDGGELFERVINDDFILSEKACVIIIKQILMAVEFIHSKNILHLDMKPENILCLSLEGNRVKICDFGLARKYDPRKKLQVLFGTPEFVAPEVVNFEPISFGTDMWSVGVICYVLLSGLSPFMGHNFVETMTNVTKNSYDFDDDAFDEVTDEAIDFIQKLLILDKKLVDDLTKIDELCSERLTPAQCLRHDWIRKPLRPITRQRIRRTSSTECEEDDETSEDELSTDILLPSKPISNLPSISSILNSKNETDEAKKRKISEDISESNKTPLDKKRRDDANNSFQNESPKSSNQIEEKMSTSSLISDKFDNAAEETHDVAPCSELDKMNECIKSDFDDVKFLPDTDSAYSSFQKYTSESDSSKEQLDEHSLSEDSKSQSTTERKENTNANNAFKNEINDKNIPVVQKKSEIETDGDISTNTIKTGNSHIETRIPLIYVSKKETSSSIPNSNIVKSELSPSTEVSKISGETNTQKTLDKTLERTFDIRETINETTKDINKDMKKLEEKPKTSKSTSPQITRKNDSVTISQPDVKPNIVNEKVKTTSSVKSRIIPITLEEDNPWLLKENSIENSNVNENNSNKQNNSKAGAGETSSNSNSNSDEKELEKTKQQLKEFVNRWNNTNDSSYAVGTPIDPSKSDCEASMPTVSEQNVDVAQKQKNDISRELEQKLEELKKLEQKCEQMVRSCDSNVNENKPANNINLIQENQKQVNRSESVRKRPDNQPSGKDEPRTRRRRSEKDSHDSKGASRSLSKKIPSRDVPLATGDSNLPLSPTELSKGIDRISLSEAVDEFQFKRNKSNRHRPSRDVPISELPMEQMISIPISYESLFPTSEKKSGTNLSRKPSKEKSRTPNLSRKPSKEKSSRPPSRAHSRESLYSNSSKTHRRPSRDAALTPVQNERLGTLNISGCEVVECTEQGMLWPDIRVVPQDENVDFENEDGELTPPEPITFKLEVPVQKIKNLEGELSSGCISMNEQSSTTLSNQQQDSKKLNDKKDEQFQHHNNSLFQPLDEMNSESLINKCNSVGTINIEGNTLNGFTSVVKSTSESNNINSYVPENKLVSWVLDNGKSNKKAVYEISPSENVEKIIDPKVSFTCERKSSNKDRPPIQKDKIITSPSIVPPFSYPLNREKSFTSVGPNGNLSEVIQTPWGELKRSPSRNSLPKSPSKTSLNPSPNSTMYPRTPSPEPYHVGSKSSISKSNSNRDLNSVSDIESPSTLSLPKQKSDAYAGKKFESAENVKYSNENSASLDKNYFKQTSLEVLHDNKKRDRNSSDKKSGEYQPTNDVKFNSLPRRRSPKNVSALDANDEILSDAKKRNIDAASTAQRRSKALSGTPLAPKKQFSFLLFSTQDRISIFEKDDKKTTARTQKPITRSKTNTPFTDDRPTSNSNSTHRRSSSTANKNNEDNNQRSERPSVVSSKLPETIKSFFKGRSSKPNLPIPPKPTVDSLDPDAAYVPIATTTLDTKLNLLTKESNADELMNTSYKSVVPFNKNANIWSISSDSESSTNSSMRRRIKSFDSLLA